MSADSYSLSRFKTGIKDIARPYMFRMRGSGGSLGNIFKRGNHFYIRTANKPNVTINQTVVNYFGMDFKLSGNVNYSELTCQLIVDEKYEIMKEVYIGLGKVFAYIKNVGPQWSPPDIYQGRIVLEPLNNKFTPTSTYTLNMAWLSQVGDISWSQDNKDTPLTCDITISYSWCEYTYAI